MEGLWEEVFLVPNLFLGETFLELDRLGDMKITLVLLALLPRPPASFSGYSEMLRR
jgi:hypothetical protein